MSNSSTPRNRRQIRQDLSALLSSLYMGDCTFMPVFDETPVQAIAAFKKSPEVFGRLRTYIGASTLTVAKGRVLKLAKLLLAMEDAVSEGSPLP